MLPFARVAAALSAACLLPAATPSPLPSPVVETVAAHQQSISSVVEDLSGTAREVHSRDGMEITINGNVLFAKDRAGLLPAARPRLAQIGDQLRQAPSGRVTITGHTDDLGSAEHGLDLSRRRAEAVRAALGTSLTGKAVDVVGRGEAEPVVPNNDEASRARNRRVVVHFTAGG